MRQEGVGVGGGGCCHAYSTWQRNRVPTCYLPTAPPVSYLRAGAGVDAGVGRAYVERLNTSSTVVKFQSKHSCFCGTPTNMKMPFSEQKNIAHHQKKRPDSPKKEAIHQMQVKETVYSVKSY